MRAVILSSALILGLASFAHGFGSGAPNAPHICASLTPKHGGEEQNSVSPYGLAVDKTSVMGGEAVTLTIVPSGGQKIRGFLIQARQANSADTTPFGRFVPGPDSQGLDCPGSDEPSNSLTHNNNNERDSVSVQWKAPSKPGTYVILATVVQDKLTYWVAQKSQTITVS